MSLNSQELTLFTKEFKELLPLKIEKLYIPEENTLVLTLYKKDFKKHLLIEVASNYSGLYFIKERPKQNLVANIQSRFRHFLLNGLLRDIIQVNNDRFLELIIDSKGVTYRVILELTGRHGNIFILNENIIESILLINKKDKKRDLSLYGEYASPILGGVAGAVREQPQRESVGAIRESPQGSFLHYLENEYSERILAEKNNIFINSFLKSVNKKIKKTKNKKKKLLKDLETLNSYKENKKIGELIKANIYQIKRGMESISVVDYYDENMKETFIELDKSKNPIENMEFYFKKYEKYKRGVVYIEKEFKKVESDLKKFELEKLKIESDDFISEVKANTSKKVTSAKKQQEVHKPYKTYMSSNGYKILVGKKSVDNDYLTFKVASGNDIWLHVISYSGSHVVIKRNNKKDLIDINSIYEAAHLAILNSKAPNNDSVEVCYTFRKYVKKPPKAKPGAVIYTMEKRVYLELDSSIIENLKLL